jgi:hypothetical protein
MVVSTEYFSSMRYKKRKPSEKPDPDLKRAIQLIFSTSKTAAYRSFLEVMKQAPKKQ